MTNGDPEGRIFLSDPNTNKGFFFLLVIEFRFLKGSQTFRNKLICDI